MSIQNRLNIINSSFITSGRSFLEDNGIIKQDAGRTQPLLQYTVMAQISATGKYVPYTSISANDGSSDPVAIYVGETIPASELTGADYTNAAMLVGGDCTIDETQLVFDAGTLGEGSIVAGAAANPIIVQTAKVALRTVGIFIGAMDATSSFENVD